MNIKHVIGYGATALVALGIGAASASGGAGETPAPTALAAAPTGTVTVPASDAAPQQTVAGHTVTKTVEVPGPVKTVTAPPPAPAVAMAGDGTYQVGVDVEPGTYVSKKSDSGNCYWARLKNGDGGSESIISNGNSAGQVVVTIKKSDKFFESNGCSDWTKR